MELKTARGRLFLLLAIIISLPLLNYNFNFIESGKLEGVSPKAELTPFSLKSWWDGTFQQQRNTLMNDSIGFRPDLVRMNNQLDYSLFSKINASSIVLGKDQYLFERTYLDEYNGVGYMGDSTIIKVCTKLKRVQDTLAKLGKTFVVAYSPSKAYFFSEKIPDYLRRLPRPKSNYDGFKHFGDSLKLKLLDYNEMFKSMRDTSKQVLMSRQGIHWSKYGGVVAADSMIKYIERERDISMPHIKIVNLKRTDTAQMPDNDLAQILNLIYPMHKEVLTYPDCEYVGKDATKPKVIYIGDSFLWLWIGNHLMEETNKDWEFWPHFHEVWTLRTITGKENGPRLMENYDWKGSVEKADCIVFMFTAINLRGFTSPNGFLENIYKHYYPNEK